ncbi:sensor histidine kinase [Jannaschia sp. CCS1]|uniref:sensor histidine kinase n=1 Tax=Jannaschia sp. (strain CCS1) TaxID=290400 RepID=UPI000053B0CA|nr:PAS domain-containing sensor histidine kinase [Jannaschia sp. CCS1]ABD56555.1 histidine kinase [Jannaschia sp. CCS1]
MIFDENKVTGMSLERLIAWVDGIDLPMFVLQLLPGDRLEFVHANATLGRVAGTPTTIFKGKSATEIFPARMAERLEGNYRKCLATDVPYSYEECLMIEGRETWWQTTLSKPVGFGGQVVLGVSSSVTEAKDREFAAAQSLANLTERLDEMRLFSTMAAHDARGPLATVSSLIELVLEDFSDLGDGKADLLRMASNTVDEALTQISSTLERARNMQTDEEVRTQVDLGRLCADIAAMVDPEKHLAIELPQIQVECDEVMVQMGVRNLMSNAARFCQHHITVDVSEDRDRGMLMIGVSDDGPGLPEGMTLQDLAQKGEARKGVHGFGLSAIAKLINSRGGTFEVVPTETEDGMHGAKFRMVLPGGIVGDGAPIQSADKANLGYTETVAAQ